ncbi:MAG: tRNA glutamyl-Q(34) synthetase GluQRS [Pararhodobacter sp.]|nr:tRNA glutamyl-Q(34) synthetase GluQRS [Pararhodobacter sp.]
MAGLTTRFAPSPTGPLHLGHAYSALTAWDLARTGGGQFLLRIEDIDQPRCRAEHEQAIYDDLRWLGLTWPEPVLRQSDRMESYAAALERLAAMGVSYACTCTRADIRAALSAPQEGAAVIGPDGPVYPGTCREAGHLAEGAAIRLNMKAALARLDAPLRFAETGPLFTGEHVVSADHLITNVGDIVLARRDIGTSYHLSVVLDDAAQGVTLVTRGADLFEATAIHVLLQRLLGLPQPEWHHHRLIRDEEGRRLAKRDDARAIARFRADGVSPAEIRAHIGL